MKVDKKIIVGSRKSLLAMRQSAIVVEKLRKLFPEHKFEIRGIVTSGDRLKVWPRKQVKGLFVKEIEQALLRGKIDLAVHSMKDMPVDLPAGLEIGAVTKRVVSGDVLISRNKKKLSALAKGSSIGTSSPRRKMQLLLIRPDLKIKDIRGNLDTRLKKLAQGDYDAIVVAGAGVLRLGWEKRISEYLKNNIMLPAPAQGALAIQMRKNDKKTALLVKKLNHAKTRTEVEAEREFLRAMGGGCRVPIGALGRIKSAKLYLEAIVIRNRSVFCRKSVIVNKKFPQRAGEKLAKKIKVSLRQLKS